MNLLDNNQNIINVNGNIILNNIQWLISLGGTIQMIEKFADYFCQTKQTILINIDKSIGLLSLSSSIVYILLTNDNGHWVYYNKKGILYNSYDLDHQKHGSSQFCQTYAILYMLGDNNNFIKRKFTDKLRSGINHHANNIKVVVKFWHLIFKHGKSLSEWMISEVKSINDYDKANNNSCITYNTMEIDKKHINKLLLYIYKHANEIALLS